MMRVHAYDFACRYVFRLIIVDYVTCRCFDTPIIYSRQHVDAAIAAATAYHDAADGRRCCRACYRYNARS